MDIYVAKLAGGSGSCLWAKRFGDGYDQSGNAVAVDGSGNVVLTGYFFSTVNFG